MIGYYYSKSKVADQYLQIIQKKDSYNLSHDSNYTILITYVMDTDCQYSNNVEVINKVNEIIRYINNSHEISKVDINTFVKFRLVSNNNPYTSIPLLQKFDFIHEINFGSDDLITRVTPQLIIEKRNTKINKSSDLFSNFESEKKSETIHLQSMSEILDFDTNLLVILE